MLHSTRILYRINLSIKSNFRLLIFDLTTEAKALLTLQGKNEEV